MSSKRTREAEEKARRKALRKRLRTVFRTVYLSNKWLLDLNTKIQLVEPKKEIAMMMRQQRIINLLTVAEKTLIQTPHSLRSVEERKRLVTLLLGLSCFARTQPKIVARLAPVMNFMFIDRGRVLIREGDDATDVYFILCGELEVSRSVYDHLNHELVDRVETISGAGDCIGDIELYENCPRRNTYLATTNVELLVVTSDDFIRLLYPVMYKQWEDKKLALKALGYFDAFTEDQIINACKYGALKQFDPLDTIFHEDTGNLTSVHFIISGEVMILQILKMNVMERKSGKKTFELVDITKEADSMFQNGRRETASTDDIVPTRKSIEDEIKKLDLHSIIGECALMKARQENALREEAAALAALKQTTAPLPKKRQLTESEEELLQQQAAVKPPADQEEIAEDQGPGSPFAPETPEELEEEDAAQAKKGTKKMDNVADAIRLQGQLHALLHAGDGSSANLASDLGSKHAMDPDALKDIIARVTAKFGSQVALALEQFIPKDAAGTRGTQVGLQLDEHDPNASTRISFAPLLQSPESTLGSARSAVVSYSSIEPEKIYPIFGVENHFIDVGSMSFGGIFGLGEKMEHRVIMARTMVQCLTLPRFWLMDKEQNPGNIWQRRRFYLDLTIPSRAALFKNYLATRRWSKFRRSVVQEGLQFASKSNPTRIEDIPIICRLLDTNGD